jgi:hypothetical protein
MLYQSSFISRFYALFHFPDEPFFLFDKLFDGVCHEPGTGSIHGFRHTTNPLQSFIIQPD